MIDWEVSGGQLHVVDGENASMWVGGDDLRVDPTESPLSRPVDETLVTTVTELRVPHEVIHVLPVGSDTSHELDPHSTEPLSLEPGEYLVDVDGEIKTYLRFSGQATISRSETYDSVTLSFPSRTRVILGFRSRHELPVGTITVPETPHCIATAISLLHSSLKTDSPDRTYPTLRGHPPLLEMGDTMEIPEAVRSAHEETGIEIVMPPDLETMYVAAPLAYYLQADVSVEQTSAPRLRASDVSIDHTFAPMPALEQEIERMVRKVFFLDSLVRNAGPYGTTLAEGSMLEALDFEAESLYSASPQERLKAYLGVTYGAIEHRIPDWHLATYIEPTHDVLETLPYLLDRLSLIFTPRTSELEGSELVERSLDDFYRAQDDGSPPVPSTPPATSAGLTRSGTGQVASVDIVKPDLKSARVHGWLADGVPIDVFKTSPTAYHNRLEYVKRGQEPTSVCVVLNDPDMMGERSNVASIYHRRAEELSLEIAVEESMGTAELGRIFESEYDFVHYIGHCEEEGLRCPDGYLATSSIAESNAQTFFLNACGSYYQGLDLVEKGSVAGAVTFKKVLNDQAVKVGSTFARLLMHGFSIERAMTLARRRIMMGKDYAVVGDGTHSLTQGEHRPPTTVAIESQPDGRYLLTVDCFSTRSTGSYYVPHLDGNDFSFLCGNRSHFVLMESQIRSFLAEAGVSVIYDGDLYWSRELFEEFDAT